MAGGAPGKRIARQLLKKSNAVFAFFLQHLELRLRHEE